jgi:hypothetical protein
MITCWLNTDYASALYAAHQVYLAGGWPDDLWYIAAWYVQAHALPIIYASEYALQLWTDIGGWTA